MGEKSEEWTLRTLLHYPPDADPRMLYIPACVAHTDFDMDSKILYSLLVVRSFLGCVVSAKIMRMPEEKFLKGLKELSQVFPKIGKPFITIEGKNITIENIYTENIKFMQSLREEEKSSK